MSDRIQENFTEIFHDVFDDDSIVVDRNLTASQVDGWDSLTHVRLLLTTERKFGVRISAAESSRLKSVGDLMDLVRNKIEQSGRPGK